MSITCKASEVTIWWRAASFRVRILELHNDYCHFTTYLRKFLNLKSPAKFWRMACKLSMISPISLDLADNILIPWMAHFWTTCFSKILKKKSQIRKNCCLKFKMRFKNKISKLLLVKSCDLFQFWELFL